MTKIISYNVNGIRAAAKKDWFGWIRATDPNIICVQETKAQPDQIPIFEMQELGYQSYVYSAQKKDYRDFSVISVYHPSGSSSDERQAFKMQWLKDFQDYIDNLKKTIPKLIISGDYNICHKPIDIHDPIRNATSSGFLPEERAWLSGFINSGFVDSFRHFNNLPHNYSWWSYRVGARLKNLGWRIDYHMVSEPLKEKMIRAYILPEAKHSDHCPVVVEMNI